MVPDQRDSVRAVTRAIQLLECLGDGRMLGPSELGKILGLNKSTVFRLLKTLQSMDFVTQAGDGGTYRLGPAALRLAQWLIFPDLTLAAQDAMIELRDQVDETVVLDVRLGDQRVCIAQVARGKDGRRSQRFGEPAALYAGAAGAVLLMDQSKWSLNDFISRVGLEQLTATTPTSTVALRKRVERAKREGYAISLSERIDGSVAVAAPVKDQLGHVEAALVVAGPATRFTGQEAKTVAPKLIKAAQQITEELAKTKHLDRPRGSATRAAREFELPAR